MTNEQLPPPLINPSALGQGLGALLPDAKVQAKDQPQNINVYVPKSDLRLVIPDYRWHPYDVIAFAGIMLGLLWIGFILGKYNV